MIQTARRRSTSPATGPAPRPRLAGHRLFRNVDAASVERCEGLFEIATLQRGTEVFAQDDDVEYVYVVVAGYVRLGFLLSDGREMSVGLVGPGEFIGEEALAEAERRPFSATVVERCTIFRARAENLSALFRADALLAMNLARHMSARYAEMSAALEDIAQGKVRDRLLRALRRIAGVKLTHHEIATFVGSTRETVTVELAALMRAGAISRGPGCFTVLSPI
jgi:CRP/FNR family transcriptional regulator, cyclic AMP receptor protein